MNKKILLLGILILGFLVIGAACSKTSTIEPATTSVGEEEGVTEETEEEEPDFLQGEITDDDEGQSDTTLFGEIDFAKDIFSDFIDTGIGDDEGASENVSVRAFNIMVKQFEFMPSIIRVKKGNRVILNITSADVEHGFAIDEYRINKTIPAGGTVTIDFIASEAGQFEFYSSIYAGAGTSNMKGKFIVEE